MITDQAKSSVVVSCQPFMVSALTLRTLRMWIIVITSFGPGEADLGARLCNTLAGCEEAGICYRNVISETSATSHRALVQQSSFNPLRYQNVTKE